MRIGVMSGEGTLEGVLAHARRLQERGFRTLWLPHIFGLDAITSAAIVGRETSRIEVGTAVVPIYPRHPTAMAQQALTAQAAAGGRFTLGVGLSHKVVIEDMLGFSYDRPARHMREYLQVLLPLLRGEAADFQGEHYRVTAGLEVPGAAPVQVLVAALGPVMLRVAGEAGAGTICWMAGPRTLNGHIGPRIRQAAKEAGREEPRIVAGFPIVLTNDPGSAREAIGQALEIYGKLPSYRALLDREGVAGPADIALVGNEKQLRSEIACLEEIGVTDLNAALVPVEEGAAERTLGFLASLV